MKKSVMLLLAGLCLLVVADDAMAAPIEFVPPNDQVGSVWTVNSNDGYSAGRGIVFRMDQTVEVSSVGIWHDLTRVDLSFELAKTATADGNVTAGQTILRSGGGNVTTNGLQWIDYKVAPVTLLAGQTYHLEFTHQGAGNQNFFYNNNNVRWAQDGFELLDGTQGGNTSNFIVAGFRVDGAVVPEPGTFALLGLGVLSLGLVRRRKSRA